MKAAVLLAPGPIESQPLQYREVNEPEPGPGEVSITVSACGVCRSNLHMIEGDWMPGTPSHFPIIPGHEVIGRVRKIGPGVTNLSLGDRVGVQPIWSTCGSCVFCLAAKDHLCRARQITGETRDGGYAQVMLANANHAYPIPESLTDAGAAALMCPGVTAYGSVKKAGLVPGKSVAVLGVGGVGHMVLQLANLTGADVYAVTRGHAHRELAEELGARRSFVPQGHEGDSALDESMDSTIVFAPSQQSVAEAYRITRPGGTIVMGVSESIGMLPIADEKQFVASLLASRGETLEMLQLAGAGKISVVHEDFPLSEANEALGLLKSGKIRARAVLIPESE